MYMIFLSKRDNYQKFINFNKETRWNEEIDYDNKKNLVLDDDTFKFKKNNFDKEEFASFIINSYRKEYFHTRGVDEKKEDEISNAISLFFKETEAVVDSDFKSKISKLKNKNLNDLLKNKNKFADEHVKEYISFVEENIKLWKKKNISKKVKIEYNSPWNNNKLLKPFKDTIQNLVFQHRILVIERKKAQTLYEFPINGILSTLRSMIENLSYFLMFYVPLFENFRSFGNYMNNIKHKNEKLKDSKSKEDFESLFLNKDKSGLHITYAFLREGYLKCDKVRKNVEESIREITNNKSISITKYLKKIFEKQVFQESSEIIHSPHLLFLEDNKKNRNSFKKNKELLLTIILLFKEMQIIKTL